MTCINLIIWCYLIYFRHFFSPSSITSIFLIICLWILLSPNKFQYDSNSKLFCFIVTIILLHVAFCCIVFAMIIESKFKYNIICILLMSLLVQCATQYSLFFRISFLPLTHFFFFVKSHCHYKQWLLHFIIRRKLWQILL